MVIHDEVSPNGSNGSSPNNNVTGFSTLEIDGHQFEYRETDDEVEVIIPEDFPEEKRSELERKTEEFKHTLASAKRKALDVNRDKEEIERQRRELEAEREALKREREQLSQRETEKPKDNALLNAFGVKSWDDVTALQVEDPEAYHRGLARYNAEVSYRDAYNRLATDRISETIQNDGYNPKSVESFAKANGISRLDVAYDYYKRVNDRPKGVSLAEIQKKSVKFVPKGAGSSQSPKAAPSMKDLFDSTD